MAKKNVSSSKSVYMESTPMSRWFTDYKKRYVRNLLYAIIFFSGLIFWAMIHWIVMVIWYVLSFWGANKLIIKLSK